MLNGIKAVVFDLDGTLLYTLEDLGESLNEVLAAEGLPTHELDEYRYFVGNGLEMLVVRALPEGLRRPEHVRPILKDFAARYRSRQCLKTRPYPGIEALLQDLASLNLPLAVLSNKAHDNTVEVVGNYFPGLFKMVLGLKPGAPPKPDPSGALAIADFLSLEPNKVLYLGDSDVDMKTALAAGMHPVGALWGYRTKAELLTAGAAATVETPAGLAALLTTGAA